MSYTSQRDGYSTTPKPQGIQMSKYNKQRNMEIQKEVGYQMFKHDLFLKSLRYHKGCSAHYKKT